MNPRTVVTAPSFAAGGSSQRLAPAADLKQRAAPTSAEQLYIPPEKKVPVPLIVGGVVLLGLGAFFLLRRKK